MQVWLPVFLLGSLAVLTRLVTPTEAGDVTTRATPILLFLVAVTVLAELADAAQVFDIAANRAALLARGRTLRLYAMVLLLGIVTTIALSLDTTAVLLTPVVLALAQGLELNPLPFAMAAVWLANTASLLLPVSNLTNLLALEELHTTTTSYAGRVGLPAAAAIAVTVVALGVWQRRLLPRRYQLPKRTTPDDALLFGGATAACGLLVVAVLAGLSVPLAATAAAGLLGLLFLVRRRQALRWSLVPWRLVLMVEGLFLLVAALGPLGLDDLLRAGVGSPMRTAFVSAGAANALNNLPAYLAVERVLPSGQLIPLLLGVNLGPLVLPWGSLATLLWAERCRARGVRISWLTFGLAGLLLVPLLLVATVPLT